ncbi:GFA family protein [Vandammella animalimorsus]|uniref:Aldehyde-activating protein n=1 Tax=Vandammella animalimorsus TaxID=2029117 RepID=A0A2A2A8L6_9BURK|nr:GFA family protein [Vandammella animalimorsus]PAT34143.1 aldehyde-activating protein [Vandammella animalimorsus]
MTRHRLQLQCPCGAVHLVIDAEPMWQGYCHCDDCRTANAAAYIAAASYPAEAVRLTQGELKARNLNGTPRMACAACGTHLFTDAPGMGIRGVNAFLLPEGVFQPQMHIQCQHAILPVRDDLPHYKDWPAAFGGSDETVNW